MKIIRSFTVLFIAAAFLQAETSVPGSKISVSSGNVDVKIDVSKAETPVKDANLFWGFTPEAPAETAASFLIFVDKKSVYVPPFAFGDLYRIKKAEINAQKEETVVRLSGGDEKESYLADFVIKDGLLVRRKLVNVDLPDNMSEETLYPAPNKNGNKLELEGKSIKGSFVSANFLEVNGETVNKSKFKVAVGINKAPSEISFAKGYWGAAGKKEDLLVNSISMTIGKLKVPFPYSAYANLVNPKEIHFISAGYTYLVVINGGEREGAYRAYFLVEHKFLKKKMVVSAGQPELAESGEFLFFDYADFQ